MTTRSSLRWIEGVLLLAGVACLVLWAKPELDARAFQVSQSKQLDADRHRVALQATGSPSARHARHAPVVASRARVNIGPGDVLGRLEVPRLGVSAIVAEGADTKTLAHAVGHVPSTALPGNPGNCALAGHRDSFLRGLRSVRLHDVIRVVTVSRTYAYRVDWMAIVGPRQVEVLDSTATRTLTLITCYPFTYVGHAPKRFVVRATQVDVATPVRARAEPVTTFRPTRRH